MAENLAPDPKTAQDACDATIVRATLVEYGIRAEIVTASGHERPMVWVPAQDHARATRLLKLLPRTIQNRGRRRTVCDPCRTEREGFEACWTCRRA